MTRPEELSPRDAVKRFLGRKQSERSDSSISTYYYRLKLFFEWCEAVGIEEVGSLSGWDFESYESARGADDIKPPSLKNEMQTLKKFIEYLERIEAVDDGLSKKVHVPNVPRHAESDDTKLATEDARELLYYYRNTDDEYGSRMHAFLELAWHTGARLGGIRGLDIRDYDREKHFVEFHHRPESDTPLKNGRDGERPVGFPAIVGEVLDHYIRHNRENIHDEHGRQPLFTTQSGNRVSKSALRTTAYQGTYACWHSVCPHGKDPETCEYRSYSKASTCPSSRSPHQIRTGSITWQRDLGFPPEVVAERVNSSVDVIERYYDKATARERMEVRRPYVEEMRFEE
ncbi:tyrosine-type recombinase/integrase [Halobacteriaceae archaeon GCM10025711]